MNGRFSIMHGLSRHTRPQFRIHETMMTIDGPRTRVCEGLFDSEHAAREHIKAFEKDCPVTSGAATQEQAPVAYREKDGADFIWYDAASEIGRHIATYPHLHDSKFIESLYDRPQAAMTLAQAIKIILNTPMDPYLARISNEACAGISEGIKAGRIHG